MARLDTHVVAWLAAGEVERLSDAARVAIDAEPPSISPVVTLELDFLHEIGRLSLPGSDIVRVLQHHLGLRIADTSLAAMCDEAASITWTRDPFDRLIIADAMCTSSDLVTKDQGIRSEYTGAVW